MYQQLTGRRPLDRPHAAKDYTEAGLPWFDYYSDSEALSGSDKLAGLSSIAGKWFQKTKQIFPGNDAVEQVVVKKLGKKQVREGEF